MPNLMHKLLLSIYLQLFSHIIEHRENELSPTNKLDVWINRTTLFEQT